MCAKIMCIGFNQVYMCCLIPQIQGTSCQNYYIGNQGIRYRGRQGGLGTGRGGAWPGAGGGVIFLFFYSGSCFQGRIDG
jgi:hypothetical protein